MKILNWLRMCVERDNDIASLRGEIGDLNRMLLLTTTERDAEITRLKEIVAAFERDFQDEMSLSQAIVERDVAIAEITRLRAELARLRELFEATRRWGAGETDAERLEKVRSAVLGVDGWRAAVLGANGWRTEYTNVQVAGKIAHAVIDALAPSVPPLDVAGFCQSWRNSAWGDDRYAEFCQGINALLAAARRAGAEEMRDIYEPVIEATEN